MMETPNKVSFQTQPALTMLRRIAAKGSDARTIIGHIQNFAIAAKWPRRNCRSSTGVTRICSSAPLALASWMVVTTCRATSSRIQNEAIQIKIPIITHHSSSSATPSSAA